jgi:GAF domain-containing protein
LQQQAATSEVLQLILSSPNDLQAVFSTILKKAVGICDAKFGNIYRWANNALSLVATHDTPVAYAEARRRSPVRPNPNNIFGRMLATKAVVHVLDAARLSKEGNREYDTAGELGGVRTCLAVPMQKGNELIGSMSLFRQEVRPFTDKQIASLTNFAAQAVIAIENARLLNELRRRTTALSEALEQQTATSDVLRVVSSSPGDLQPVFATMLEKAVRICDAKQGNIYRWNGETFDLLATHNMAPGFLEHRRHVPLRPGLMDPIARMVATKTVVNVADLATEKDYIERTIPAMVAAVELGGVRTFMAVPMLKENELIGAFNIFRQEVRPFTEKQIALISNFANQAVIAMENARLLNELHEKWPRGSRHDGARRHDGLWHDGTRRYDGWWRHDGARSRHAVHLRSDG